MDALTITLVDDGRWLAARADVDDADLDEPEPTVIASGRLPESLAEAPAWQRRRLARELAERVCVRLRRSLEPGEPIHRRGFHPDIEHTVDTYSWLIRDTAWCLGAIGRYNTIAEQG